MLKKGDILECINDFGFIGWIDIRVGDKVKFLELEDFDCIRVLGDNGRTEGVFIQNKTDDKAYRFKRVKLNCWDN